MKPVTLQLSIRAKWWMLPALWIVVLALKVRLIGDKPSVEHFDGIITAEERAAKWLADYAFRIGAA